MARFERLLIPIVLVVVIGAFWLEDLQATTVRGIAIGLGILLAVAIVVGMIHRVRRKGRDPAQAPGQTSNDDAPPQPPA
jgi:uncharacterized SAM-binding protein YcdF (DUF218 family)